MDAERWVAFSTDPAGGNPAGVVVRDTAPSPEEMLATAAAVGYSETATLVPTGPGRWWTRYHAPAAEVAFCGHATIASAVALGTADPGLDELVLETAIGDVAVTLDRSRPVVRATLTSRRPTTAPLGVALRDRLLALFGWGPADLDPTLPVAVADAGVAHPVVALRERATLAAMTYPFEALRELMAAHGWTTVQLVHREDERTLHARDPFPVGGVVEDPATGAAAAALGGHLRALGQLPPDGRVVVHQGHDLGRPSLLEVDASGDEGVRVTGAAVPVP